MTTDAHSWRGVAAEKADEVTAGLAALLRERSRRLLGNLLRPHRRAVIATISLIVVESLAALAGPWLVGLAIDNGLPPLLHAHDGRRCSASPPPSPARSRSRPSRPACSSP